MEVAEAEALALARARNEEVEKIFKALDTDGSGTVELDEFLQLQASLGINEVVGLSGVECGCGSGRGAWAVVGMRVGFG